MKKKTFWYWVSLVWVWLLILFLSGFIGVSLVNLYRSNPKMFVQLFLLEFSIISFFVALARVMRG